ncbi:MAG: preprotein translocase subunit SecG [Caldimonas sp.]
MNIVMNLVVALQIITALVMIGLVLIQHGKGADMGASFGSGASGSLFGATGSANFLSRSTAVCAAVFFACTLALAYAAHERPKASTGSILDQPSTSASAPIAPASGVALIPGAVPMPAAASATPASASDPSAVSAGASGAAAIPQK